MQWLFDQNLICESKLYGPLEIVDKRVMYVLKKLYYKEVISYWHYP